MGKMGCIVSNVHPAQGVLPYCLLKAAGLKHDELQVSGRLIILWKKNNNSVYVF